MSAPSRKLRVGVTLNLRQGHQSIWENGIFQNCAFLVQLFQRSPAVGKAVLVNAGDAEAPADAMMLKDAGFPVISLAEAMGSLDVLFEMSALVPEDWVAQFRRRGGRIAMMKVGNDYVIDIERAMFDKPSGWLISDKQYDAIWTLPQYQGICKDYFELTTRAPVRILPHLWTPYFFDKGIASLPAGIEFGYRPGRERWRVCCFEPNVCMVKTSFIPMLAIEEAYRAQPAFLESARLLNTLHMKDHAQFASFARQLDIVNHGLASFESRFAVYEYMSHYGDCIVSHQWENAQNYIYYEALYGGYPLVHNSPLLRGVGYYYPDFDCKAGGQALLRAFREHDGNLPGYRQQAKEVLAGLDVANPENIETYTRELLALFPPG
jgi:hypothetical protein